MTDHTRVSQASWLTRARNLSEAALNLIFPPVCAHCGREGQLLCQNCLELVEWLSAPICQRCGRSLPTDSSREICTGCHTRPLAANPIRAAAVFAGPVPNLIHQLKYNNMFGLAAPLANLMSIAWLRWQMPVDLVIAIPLHKRRHKERGYNQSELLVNHFCQQQGLTAHTHALQRVRHTRPQVDLDAAHRQENMQDAFHADATAVAGKRILLVDDVCTTGATLDAAAAALVAAGATAVSAFCLARAT